MSTTSFDVMLSGTGVALRAPVDEDLEMLVGLRNDLEMQRQLMAIPRPNTVQRVREWTQKRLADPQTAFFIVAHQETNLACGFVQITEMNPLHGTGVVGICLDSAHQGRGYGREALTLAGDYAQATMGLRKLVLKVLAANQRAIGLYEKLGYRHVGVLKEHFYSQNMYHDVVVMEVFLGR